MNLFGYLRAVRAHWLTALSLVIICSAAAGFYSINQPKIYRANIQMFVSVANGAGDISALYQGGNFTTERMHSYVQIVNSPAVTDLVKSQLKLTTSTESIGSLISASSPTDTVLLDVAVQDHSPELAQAIANSIADNFPTVIQDIEKPDSGGSSPVQVSVTRKATLPERPVSPRTKVNVALGLIIGLILGISFATLRYRLDRKIRDIEQAAQITNVPVLGGISEDSSFASRELVAGIRGSIRAEEIRHLRTNIRFLSVGKKLSSFVVTSSVAGEGKTLVTANLAVAIAQLGENVVLIDGDLRKPRVADVFGLPAGVGLTNVLVGDVSVNHALQQWRENASLYILAAGPVPPNPSELLSSERLQALIDELINAGYLVIFDASPLLPVTDAALLARVTGGALLVTHIGKTRSDELRNSTEIVRTAGGNILGLIGNHVRKSSAGGYYGAAPSQEPVGAYSRHGRH
ncbi:polysaccharide biosynthesis tyrosine autokinase [Pseudofrankia sp. DC12]|uniref:polysaccharide biosynthesis tyrosine autokinase n=1 Tax=Pseudofrankia sp. DC12 TaxID=683315 RepID=UPI000A8AF537|nr:polysaccharide biosynthesis tyrosine autokinase [Pseudofrankia sp. DC12]